MRGRIGSEERQWLTRPKTEKWLCNARLRRLFGEQPAKKLERPAMRGEGAVKPLFPMHFTSELAEGARLTHRPAIAQPASHSKSR